MDRVAQLHAAAVLAFAHPGRELVALGPVHVAERPDHSVAHPCLLCGDGVEQPAAHDLEGLVGRRRLPLGGLAGHDVLELLQRGAPLGAAHLHVGGGDGDEHHHVGDGGSGLGEGLGERELGVEVSSGEALAAGAVVLAAVAQLAGVGDPLVDEHHRGAEALKQRRQGGAGTGAG